MKKTMKQIGAAVLSLSMVLALTACGGKSTPAEVMEDAQKKLNEAKSMSYEMTMEMEIAAMGETVNMTMTGTADYIADPAKMDMDMVMDMGELGSMKSKTYIEEKDGAYIVYSGSDDGTGNMTWSSQTLDGIDALKQYDAQASMDMYISNGDSFVENGTESINGKNATRYDGIISGDSLSEVVGSTGVLDQVSSLGIDEETMKSMFTDMGDLPVSIWVEDGSGMPVKYEMDMSEMMQKMFNNIMGNEDITGGEEIDLTVNKVIMSMTISNFNGVDDITIPEEVLAAAK